MKEPYLITLKNRRSLCYARLELTEKSLIELQAKCDLLSDLIAEIESKDFDVERIKPESSSTPPASSST